MLIFLLILYAKFLSLYIREEHPKQEFDFFVFFKINTSGKYSIFKVFNIKYFGLRNIIYLVPI